MILVSTLLAQASSLESKAARQSRPLLPIDPTEGRKGNRPHNHSSDFDDGEECRPWEVDTQSSKSTRVDLVVDFPAGDLCAI